MEIPLKKVYPQRQSTGGLMGILRSTHKAAYDSTSRQEVSQMLKRFLSKLVTLFCLAGPAWYFGMVTLVVSQNGGLYMEARGWIYFSIACTLAIVGLIRLFEIPVLRYRIKLVEKDGPTPRASKL